MNRKTAIVLGGTAPHIELVNKLKSRGYYTVLVDYLDNSPCIEYADKHVKESTLDAEKVSDIAKEEKAELVISTCIDQANSVCCYAAEKLGLPKPYSYKTSLDVTDKGLMKKIMIDNDIPTSWYFVVKDINEIDFDRIKYPAVVKPVDCNSSKGVHRADSKEEVIKYVKEAIDLSRTDSAIIEGFNSGEEIQVDCFANEAGAIVIMTRQKQKIAADNGMVLQSFGSIIPAPLNDELNIQAKEIADKIARAFGLSNTPFFYQAIVTDEGIQVLEFAPRIGGGLSYYLLNNIAGYDAVEAAIDSFEGIKAKVEPKEISGCYSTNLLYTRPGVFDHISGLDELKANGTVTETFVTKKAGTVIDSDMRSSNRVGAFIVKADSYDELYKKAKKAYDSIEIYDTENKPMMNRSVYEGRLK